MSDQAIGANEEDGASGDRLAIVARWLAPIIAVFVYKIPEWYDLKMEDPARVTAAIASLMAIWWMTEALPLAVTSLLPLVLFPLTGVMSTKEAAVPYADQAVYLFFGGFIIALSIEKWNLHRRIALITVLGVGTNPARLIGGVMLATAAISMWISNTATAAMMLPLGISLITLLNERIGAASQRKIEGETTNLDSNNFATAIMLGIAYAATMGGLGTLVGTPTNVTLVGFIRNIKDADPIEIGFGQWMLIGVPLAAAFLLFTWVLLTHILFPIHIKSIPGGRELIREELTKLGPTSRGERVVIFVFVCTALSWIFFKPVVNTSLHTLLPFLNGDWKSLAGYFPFLGRVDDTIIGLTGAISLFLIPVNRRKREFAMDWKTANKMPWAVLILFGGGFSLAEAMKVSKLADWIGGQVHLLRELPGWAIVLIVVAGIVFLGELTSNTPTAQALLPVFYGVAKGVGLDPMLLLIAVAISASCSFMLPVGTPPNAIVFGTGYIKIAQMCKAGFFINIAGIFLITLAVYTLGVWAFGIKP